MNMQALWEVNYRGMRHNDAERQHPKYFTWLMPKMGELKLNFDGVLPTVWLDVGF